jgi:hypothetical protein
MKTNFHSFIGQNYFNQKTKSDLEAAANAAHLSINLKVKGDVVEGTDIPFPDFKDIDVEDNRLTVTIDVYGTIQTIKRR